MHIADLTLFFAPHSGGVKRYLLAKHRYLDQQNGVRHSLIVPGARDAEVADGIFEMKSPRVPYGGGYRVPLFPQRWRKLLNRLAPDIVEAGDPYHLAWAALAAAKDLGIASVAFAHSDLPRVLASHVSPVAGSRWPTHTCVVCMHASISCMAPSRSIADRLKHRGVKKCRNTTARRRLRYLSSRRARSGIARRVGLGDATFACSSSPAAWRAKNKFLCSSIRSLALATHTILLLVGGECRERLTSNVTAPSATNRKVRAWRACSQARTRSCTRARKKPLA